jgi:Tol biopolymer transport system component
VKKLTCLTAVLCLTALASESFGASPKLPLTRAGQIGKPEGQIAFIRDGDVWIMNADGSGQDQICDINNADGRLSWTPDNRNVWFTRSGMVQPTLPDGLGGGHKLYDIFSASLDSAYANKKLFWFRHTMDVGSRDPEWSVDGSEVLFWKDLNSNQVNAGEPSYQLCTMDPNGSSIEIIRKDWQVMGNDGLMYPSRNANGDIAAVYFQKLKPIGLCILPKGKYMISADSLRTQANKFKGLVGPSWSPDGKWLACINNSMTDAGLYVLTPDLKETFLVFAPPGTTGPMTVAPGWSPDSKWLTLSTNDGSIWIVDISGNGARRLSGPGTDKFPAWSKAGKKR